MTGDERRVVRCRWVAVGLFLVALATLLLFLGFEKPPLAAPAVAVLGVFAIVHGYITRGDDV